MANVYAVKSGNWSDTTLWNTNSLPTTVDDVFANNFTVYVDNSYRVLSVQNLSATSITRGGSFILNSGVSLSANVIGGGQANIFCVRFLSASPSFATLVGSVSTNGALVSIQNAFALELSGTGTLTVIGSALGGVNNNSGTGVSDGYIQVNAPGTLNIFGDVLGSLNGNVYYGIHNRAAGTVNVVGNVKGRTVAVAGVNLYVINNASTGTVNVTGNVIGGIDNGNIGIFNNSTGAINVRGNVTGGTGGSISSFGISSNNGTVTITGIVLGGSNTSAHGVSIAPTSVLTIQGDIYGGTGGSANGINFNSSGTVPPSAYIIGNVYGGIGSNAYGVYSAGSIANFISLTGNLLSNPAGGTSSNIRTDTTPNSVINIIGNIASSGGGVRLEHSGTGTINLVGNVSGSPINTNDHRVISNFSSGTVNITGTLINDKSVNGYLVVSGGGGAGIVNIYGDIYGGTVTNAVALYNDGGALMQIFGNVYARDGGGATQNQSNGTLIISGNAYGGGASSVGAKNNNLGTVIVSGTVIGGYGSGGYGAFNNSTGILRVKRAVGNDWGLNSQGVYASVPGVFSNNAGSQTFVEELQCGARGQWPTGGNVYFTPNTKATSTFKNNTFQTTTLIESNSADSLFPPTSSVRQGTTYNLSLSTGTCNVPPASSVIAGAAVDNTVGTAVLTPASTWNYTLTSITDTASMGGRLRNASTTSGTGSLLASFNL